MGMRRNRRFPLPDLNLTPQGSDLPSLEFKGKKVAVKRGKKRQSNDTDAQGRPRK